MAQRNVKANSVSLEHVSEQSQSSVFSGFTEGTTSNSEPLRLSQFPFPRPPSDLPEVRSHHLSRVAPFFPVRKLPAVPESAPSAAQSQPAPKSPPNRAATSTTIASPHDWHEGASSIDVDATEDRLLPTSFITSLLREDKGPWIGQRASFSSDAVSKISEMTYPPINVPSASRRPEQKPQEAHPPPSSYYRKTEERSKALREDARSYLTFTSDTRTVVVQESGHSEKYTITVTPTVLQGVSRRASAGQKIVEWNAERVEDPTYKYRQSVSAKSSTPSILSRISSHKSIRRIFVRTKVKPLPPVPLIPDIPIAVEREHRKAEEATPLPELLQRAGTLRDLLERGYHPHHSLNSYHVVSEVKNLASNNIDQYVPRSGNERQHSPLDRGMGWLNRRMTGSARPPSRSEAIKHWFINLFPLLLLMVVIIAVVVGVTVSKKSHRAGASCPGNFTGAACDLDATCVCTSETSGQCNGLARSIVDLIPNLDDQFMLNLTVQDVYIGLWQAQGSPSGFKCTNQALLIDVAPALDSRSSPNRTQWARTAILWNLVESQDLEASQKLRSFVLGAPWNELLTENSIGETTFLTNVSGYIFDFASQTILPPVQSFSVIAQPSAEQDSRLNPLSRSALGYMYGYAVASSIQHNKSLMNYWQIVLNRQPNELQAFRMALGMSPILLPFDANTGFMSNQLSTSTTISKLFPPLACYPALNETTLEKLNTVENGIFKLSTVASQSSFTADCFPNHPVYGVLDVLHLRLPFSDSRKGLPKQAVLLQPAVSPRAIIYIGELLSSLALSTEGVPLTPLQLNPMRFGTLNHFDHVISNYLLGMPNTTVANALIDFVLATTHVPPAKNSILFSSLDVIPVMEVAVFGSVQFTDIQSVSSSFTTSSGSLFFGSTYGTILRQWSIAGIKSTLTWAQSALSPQIVRERNLTDKVFDEIWNAASQSKNVPTAINNLTTSLAAYGYFAP